MKIYDYMMKWLLRGAYGNSGPATARRHVEIPSVILHTEFASSRSVGGATTNLRVDVPDWMDF